MPIISYTVLRNLAGPLRSRYSSFFAWIGRLHVEMFIAQYHIWLRWPPSPGELHCTGNCYSADTHGVLVLTPNYPVINVLLTTFIFICACHELHQVIDALY